MIELNSNNSFNNDTINEIISQNINIIILKDIKNVLNAYFKNIDIQYYKYYYNCLDNIKYDIFQDLDLYLFLINSINFANNIINNQDTILLYKSNIWKIFIYDNMMWNLPFTLDDIIFIPIKYIKLSSINNNYYEFTKTIIHERIHVSQRINLNIWNNYIKENNDEWIKIENNDEIFKFIKNFNFYDLFNNINIINPDTSYDDFTYLYKYDNNLYYGLFVLIDSNPIIKWLKINTNTDNNFYFEKINLNINKTEHPFEYYAYKLSDDYIIKYYYEIRKLLQQNNTDKY
jgi:hypothetical protein